MVVEVSVIIPTKNRGPLLRDCLRAVFAQSIPVEVVVMNDASTDDTEAMVRSDFPAARVFTADVSRGPTYQRNRGVRETTGRYLVTLDDDCILANPDTLRQTLTLFDDERIAAVTIPFVNVLRDSILRNAAPHAVGHFVRYDYYGGMVVFRRDAYLAAGGYRESLFYYGEEADMALRLLGQGQFVRLGSAVPIEHMESPVRLSARIVQLSIRNAIWFSLHNVPMPNVLIHFPGTLLSVARAAARRGQTVDTLRGLIAGLRGIPAALRERRPVSRRAYRVSRLLRRRGVMALDEAARALAPDHVA